MAHRLNLAREYCAEDKKGWLYAPNLCVVLLIEAIDLAHRLHADCATKARVFRENR